MKRIIILLIFLNFAITVSAKSPSSQVPILDGYKTDLRGYNINGSNYYKLRDVAALLKGTDVEFSVGYNNIKRRVEIARDGSYTPLKDDLKPLSESKSEPKKSPNKVFIDGYPHFVNAYIIDGYNYFKLRELGKLIGFIVDYDADEDSVIIESRKIEPRLLANDPVKIKPKSLSFYNFHIDMQKKDIINFDDILKEIGNIAMGTANNGVVVGYGDYDIERDVVFVYPLMGKYIGTIYFKPDIKLISQGEEVDVNPSYNINIKRILDENNFDKHEPYQLKIGYMVGDTQNDYRKICTIYFK